LEKRLLIKAAKCRVFCLSESKRHYKSSASKRDKKKKNLAPIFKIQDLQLADVDKFVSACIFQCIITTSTRDGMHMGLVSVSGN